MIGFEYLSSIPLNTPTSAPGRKDRRPVLEFALSSGEFEIPHAPEGSAEIVKDAAH